MLVVMLAAFLLAVHEDTHVRAADAGRHAALGTDLHAGNQMIHRFQERRLVVQKLIQRAHEHIAGRTHRTFKIQSVHRPFPPILPSG